MTKQNWSAYPQLKMHESQGQVHRPERVNQGTVPMTPFIALSDSVSANKHLYQE